MINIIGRFLKYFIRIAYLPGAVSESLIKKKDEQKGKEILQAIKNNQKKIRNIFYLLCQNIKFEIIFFTNTEK